MTTMGERKIKEPAHSALNCTAKGEQEENQRKRWDVKMASAKYGDKGIFSMIAWS